MQQPTDLVLKVRNLITQAQEAESRDALKVALSCYEDALVILQNILQNKQNKYLAASIADYASKCVDRAEYIRDLLYSGDSLLENDCNGGSLTKSKRDNGGGRGNQSDGERDKEKDRMVQNLEMTRTDPTELNVTWQDVVGMTKIKKLLQEAIEMPRDFPHLFVGNRSPTRSVLFYGPPGTGKTFLGKVVACSSNMPFYAVSSADLISKFVGESEKYVKTLFEMVKRDKPCVLFLDELESLCAKREETSHTNTVQQFLVQLDGISQGGSMDGVLLIGCSNLPWRLDEAMIRRLEKRIYVPLPTIDEREAQLRFYFNKNENGLRNEEFRELALATDYFSAADIRDLAKCAAMLPLRFMREAEHFELLKDGNLRPCGAEDELGLPMTFEQIPDKKTIVVPPISYKMVLEALECTKSTIDTIKLKEYDEWTRKYGQ